MRGADQWSLSRRRFLQRSLTLAVGVRMLGGQRILAEGRDGCTRWAFLSDTHVASDPDHRYNGFHPSGNLQDIVGEIACDLPDGAVITGDLAWKRGESGAYDNLKMILTPVTANRPVCLALGNHDNRTGFHGAFGGLIEDNMTVPDRHVATAVAGPARLIILDSLLVDRASGLLGESQRAWLKAFLVACDDRPVILFFHHRPRIDLLDTPRLFDIIEPVAKVKAVVYGHSHEFGFSEYKGIHMVNLPSTGFTMSGGQPVGWVEARITSRGGEFVLHALAGNRKRDGCCTRLFWRA